MKPILDLRLPPHSRWKPVLQTQRDQWFAAQEAFLPDLTYLRRAASHVRALAFSPAMQIEITSAVEVLPGIQPAVLKAAQVMYDEAWNMCREDATHPVCGCTSVSTQSKFGRNLDWNYPHNAEELVTEFTVVDTHGREFVAEGFAGLLGWLALSGEDLAVSLNQAPAIRPISRTAVPALSWFRDILGLADEPLLEALEEIPLRKVVEWESPWLPGADVLMHLVVGGRRYIVETYGRRVRIKACGLREKVAQANTYQLFPFRMSEEWEEDSEWRMAVALGEPTVQRGLRACSVPGFTVHQFMMR